MAYIEQDSTARISATQKQAPWGLARLSSKTTGATRYSYDSSAGKGTCAYVLDTGIDTEHPVSHFCLLSRLQLTEPRISKVVPSLSPRMLMISGMMTTATALTVLAPSDQRHMESPRRLTFTVSSSSIQPEKELRTSSHFNPL